MNPDWLDANDVVRHYVVPRHKRRRNHVSGYVQRRREDVRNGIDRDQQSDAFRRNTHRHNQRRNDEQPAVRNAGCAKASEDPVVEQALQRHIWQVAPESPTSGHVRWRRGDQDSCSEH